MVRRTGLLARRLRLIAIQGGPGDPPYKPVNLHRESYNNRTGNENFTLLHAVNGNAWVIDALAVTQMRATTSNL